MVMPVVMSYKLQCLPAIYSFCLLSISRLPRQQSSWLTSWHNDGSGCVICRHLDLVWRQLEEVWPRIRPSVPLVGLFITPTCTVVQPNPGTPACPLTDRRQTVSNIPQWAPQTPQHNRNAYVLHVLFFFIDLHHHFWNHKSVMICEEQSKFWHYN